MRPLVNLSGEPFRNRRLFWLSLLIIFGLSLFGAWRSIQRLSQLDAELAARSPAIREIEAKVREVNKAAPVQPSLTPEQTRAYWAANGLITRKVFSWTLLLNDIERLIPRGVRVLRVGQSKGVTSERPAGESARVTVPLEMEVIAKSFGDVTQMVNAFNSTGVFVVSPKWQKPVEGLTDIQFGFDIEYQPPPVLPMAPAKASSQQIAERR